MTLIELVITLLIMGILAAGAAPRFAALLATYRVEAAEKRVRADLAYAQSCAKLKGASQSVLFDPAAHAYTLPGVTDLDQRPAGYTVHLSAYPYNAALITAESDSHDHTISYNGYGFVTSGGTIVVAANGVQRQIRVVSGTTLSSLPR